jgi:hypothetical protein
VIIPATAGRWYALITTHDSPTGLITRRVVAWDTEKISSGITHSSALIPDYHGALVTPSALGTLHGVHDADVEPVPGLIPPHPVDEQR